MSAERLFVRVTRELLPTVSSRVPFLYLEHGRLEIDDSSVKWCDAAGQVIPLPIATIGTLLLGPGTSITHDAVRTCASANCQVSWVGEDSLLFYATGIVPTANTRNMRHQAILSCDPVKSLEVARRMFARRFPEADLSGKSLKEMMGMEGHRVRAIYQEKAETYKVGWKGRVFTPGNFELSDLTNQLLTVSNAALYAITCSTVNALGYSPHLGFIHSGSPLPFVYDIADIYKEHLCIDLAFYLTREMMGSYDKHMFSSCLRRRMLDMDLLGSLPKDISLVLGEKNARRPG